MRWTMDTRKRHRYFAIPYCTFTVPYYALLYLIVPLTAWNFLGKSPTLLYLTVPYCTCWVVVRSHPSTACQVELLREELGVDFVVLAGYLKLIPSELCRAYPRGILNIHPALLPAFGGKGFYGKRVHQAVVESGARFSGATVHFVDEEYDRGPILAQRTVEVRPGDSAEDLAARVLREEHQLYSEALAALCSERVEWREDGIPFIWKAS